jgi:NlpC/P60 family putative phage cell wall peptidase
MCLNDNEDAILRMRIVDEARSWLSTPYHHLGDIKGIGVDCAMILVRVYQAVGMVPTDFDPRPYEAEWYLHRDEERYMAGMEQYSHRIELADAKPGDIALYRFGRTAAHGAIIVDHEMMIHAYKPHGNVELCEMRTHEHRLDSVWSLF